MVQSLRPQLSRTSALRRAAAALRCQPTTMSATAMSTKVLREALKVKPGQYSTFTSMSRRSLAQIPHPSTYPVKPQEEPLVFTKPSRPGKPLYARPQLKNIPELPDLKVRWPLYLAVGAAAASIWGAFLLYTTNSERLSTSVVKQFTQKIKHSDNPELIEALGTRIEPEPVWYMLNNPRIRGQVNMLRGNIDVSVRVRGDKGAGTVYFTSIRKEKGIPFTILRFKVICDDGRVINLDTALDS